MRQGFLVRYRGPARIVCTIFRIAPGRDDAGTSFFGDKILIVPLCGSCVKNLSGVNKAFTPELRTLVVVRETLIFR